MTTKEAEARYSAEHEMKMAGKNWAVFNPKNLSLEELPVIYGFNNGGSPGWMDAVLLAEDGTCLGSHLCSNESYMPHDLGILEGTRPDRHKTFKEHYPDGYRMEFVSFGEIEGHKELNLAFQRNKKEEPK